ncbi:carotenoid oxygenase family protein [Kribbella sp. NPDC023855]|uniref:carotenoid oxygenase family protein n=1 Tax=Kribbella sp. NPDC023855 TaxID=3154698 RepID=UPI003403105F
MTGRDATGAAPYAIGFADLDSEVSIDELPVEGELPEWLSGTLIRNGPARYGVGNGRSLRHWFVDTPNYRSVRDQGRIGYPEFATDPCGSLFSRFFTRFFGAPGVNPVVNIQPFGESAVAVTERPLAVEFDPATLATLRVTGYRDKLSGNVTTAHPHADPNDNSVINYLLKFGRRSSYQLHRQEAARSDRRLISSVPVDQPGYMHDGRVRGSYQTEACFVFHHINAWDNEDEVVFDLCGYPDASVIDALYLDALRENRGIPLALPTRFRVQLASGTVTRETLSDEPLELPNIAYSHHNGRPYQFGYGAGARDRRGLNFLDQLVKLDTPTGATKSWYQDGCYPSEPVFVPRPAAVDEDDGVVLSVVLDTNDTTSFLLVLAAGTFAELGSCSRSARNSVRISR